MNIEAFLESIATDAVDERKSKNKWKKVAAATFVGWILTILIMFGLMYAANEVSKETRAQHVGDHAELVSSDGARVRCPSADLEVDESGALKQLGTASQIGTSPLTPGVSGGNFEDDGKRMSMDDVLKLNASYTG